MSLSLLENSRLWNQISCSCPFRRVTRVSSCFWGPQIGPMLWTPPCVDRDALTRSWRFVAKRWDTVGVKVLTELIAKGHRGGSYATLHESVCALRLPKVLCSAHLLFHFRESFCDADYFLMVGRCSQRSWASRHLPKAARVCAVRRHQGRTSAAGRRCSRIRGSRPRRCMQGSRQVVSTRPCLKNKQKKAPKTSMYHVSPPKTAWIRNFLDRSVLFFS